MKTHLKVFKIDDKFARMFFSRLSEDQPGRRVKSSPFKILDYVDKSIDEDTSSSDTDGTDSDDDRTDNDNDGTESEDDTMDMYDLKCWNFQVISFREICHVICASNRFSNQQKPIHRPDFRNIPSQQHECTVRYNRRSTFDLTY